MLIRRGFFEDFAAAEKPGTLGSQAMCATPWDSNPSRKNEIEVLRRPVESTAKSGHEPLSLDYLIGAPDKRVRHREAECFRGLKIDDEFNLGGLLDR